MMGLPAVKGDMENSQSFDIPPHLCFCVNNRQGCQKMSHITPTGQRLGEIRLTRLRSQIQLKAVLDPTLSTKAEGCPQTISDLTASSSVWCLP